MLSGTSPDHLSPATAVGADLSPHPRTPTWPSVVHVVAWHDALVDRHGHDPRSPYVETFWLPVLGPSTILLLRRLASALDAAPEGFALDLDQTAAALGLGGRTGRHAPFQRTLDRCITFAMAQRLGDTVAVRRFLPPLARRHLARLPRSLQEHHDRVVAGGAHRSAGHSPAGSGTDPTRTAGTTTTAAAGPATPTTAGPATSAASPPAPAGPATSVAGPPAPAGPAAPAVDVRTRARQLALSLLRMGEDAPAVVQQLVRWGTHPAAVHDAVNWAIAYDQASDGRDGPALGPDAERSRAGASGTVPGAGQQPPGQRCGAAFAPAPAPTATPDAVARRSPAPPDRAQGAVAASAAAPSTPSVAVAGSTAP